MAIIRRTSWILALLCSAGLLVVGVANGTTPAEPVTPTFSGHKARVAQGGEVDLAAPVLTTIELARLRPEFEKLKPRVRTNTE
ncbi:MAG: hypothetical protein Q8N51_10620 [Gammaproteobacteria bacterium]|nr:hypothetical protein [Gammaproteobacteria bacterium]